MYCSQKHYYHLWKLWKKSSPNNLNIISGAFTVAVSLVKQHPQSCGEARENHYFLRFGKFLGVHFSIFDVIWSISKFPKKNSADANLHVA